MEEQKASFNIQKLNAYKTQGIQNKQKASQKEKKNKVATKELKQTAKKSKVKIKKRHKKPKPRHEEALEQNAGWQHRGRQTDTNDRPSNMEQHGTN